MAVGDVTHFEWDSVYVFFPYTSGADINDTSGTRAVPSDVEIGEFEDWLVFTRDGRLVGVEVLPDLLNPCDRNRYGRDVQLIATTYCGFVLGAAQDTAIPAGCN